MKKNRLLLTSVFGPYGKKNNFAEAIGMQMEWKNNQLTREQAVHSPRVSYLTFPLYFLAENISVDTTVLDFPTWKAFTCELNQGYTHVGISFIVPNVLKAKRMAEYIRKNHPAIKIILGGYGTSIPNIRGEVPCDEICMGEGINWLRAYFGEDPHSPITHPILPRTHYYYVYGVKKKDTSSIIFPGLGCENRCFFCATSNKFKGYINLFKKGSEIFSILKKIETKRKTHEFAILDENFLKNRERVKELLWEMEKNNKAYSFGIFSSADTIRELGIDFLVRLGVYVVFIGVESEKNDFDKLRNIDVAQLIMELQANGISVIASAMLFLEHHDRAALEKEIEWGISLQADIQQFMPLIPWPGTPLYEKYINENRIDPHFPLKKMHGLDDLAFRHPHFDSKEAYWITRNAYRRTYLENGPSVVRIAITSVRGYLKAVRDFASRQEMKVGWNSEKQFYEKQQNPEIDKFMIARIEILREAALEKRSIILAAKIFSPNQRARQKCDEALKLYQEAFGTPTWKERLISWAIVITAAVESIKIWGSRVSGKETVVRQPPLNRVQYP